MGDVQSVMKDPDFLGLPATEKVKVLSHMDADFAGLPAGEQMKVIGIGTPKPQQNFSAMSPQDLASEAMKNSGVSSPPNARPVPSLGYQGIQPVQSSMMGSALNTAAENLKNYGTVAKAVGQDASGLAQGGAGLLKDALVNGNGTIDGSALALGRGIVTPIVQSAQDKTKSKAETLGTAAGVNSDAIKEAALKQDYPSLIGHSILPISLAAAGGKVAKEIAPTASDLGLPTRAHASGLFSEVGDAIGDTPIQAGGAAGDAALRVQELSKRGLTMPKVVGDFIKRMTDPTKGPLTYEEARDFASNASNLSRKETSAMRPKMKVAVGEFAGSVNDAVASAADQFGKKAEYLDAMGEYAAASQWRNRAALLAKVISKTSQIGAGLYAANKVGSGLINGK